MQLVDARPIDRPQFFRIDTFNSSKYGLLHGKVLSVSADPIMRERAAGQGSDKTVNASGAKSSEPQGQELTYAARIALEETRMQIDDRLIDLVAGRAVTVDNGGDQDRAAADHRILVVTAAALPTGELEGEMSAIAVRQLTRPSPQGRICI